MVYKIKKGKHKSWYLPKFIWRNALDFNFQFLSEPSYICEDSDNQEDINKIYGFSDSWNHHKHSIRIGWYYDKKYLSCNLVVYYYINGVRNIKHLGEFSINEKINIQIEILDDLYIVRRKEIRLTHLIPRESRWCFLRYILFPYFGGQEKSPKDFLIKIN